MQIAVLPVFYSCEQKMTKAVYGPKQAVILDPRKFHQQSYPQVGGLLSALGQEQQITRRQRRFAECAQMHGIALLDQKKRAIQIQPKLQWPAE